ncbi:MAG TPA: hypothetical protein VFU40_04585 [Gemmatimonadales bacterium]|nr:hypothetical protein [Gemmatimonadales bacterium]
MAVIRVDVAPGRLRPAERFGLDVLIDLSRLLVAEQAECNVVRLTVVDRPYSELPAADLVPRVALERADGEVRVSTAALYAVAETAGGAAEQRSGAVDRHGRVPPEENPLVAAGRSREPLVSILAAELRKAAGEVAERRPMRFLAPWPNGYRWAALVTHDLDVVERWILFPFLRMAELSRRGMWRLTARVARAASRSIGHDPVTHGVHALLQLEAHHGIPATWFVICSEPTLRSLLAGDSTYRPDAPTTHRILNAVGQAGHEIGLHGSFATVGDAGRLASQRRWLGQLTQRTVTGVRQHFLRMRPGATQRAMVKAGFEYDATWGFADRNGFRLGVADVVPAWDDARAAVMPLDLVPLIWMDRALSKYAGVEDARRWVEDGLQLARASRAVEGTWVGLWHPNSTEALGFPGAEAALVHLLQTLANERPYFATARKIIEWRRFRRSVRAAHISADGRVVLTAMPGYSTVAIEDAAGDTTQAPVRSEQASGAA